ncbi:MAG: four helix bundle protein [Candidatus Omnitrophica bacterium]|nr:four helix bundle protein [Candidatus Omnitrophota bacterium]
MKQDNVIRDKSYAFALSIVKLYQFLINEKKEFVLSRQILRSGTSIGANVEEAIGGQSGRDFQSKMAIAYKEARETHYWIRLLKDSDYLNDEHSQPILSDCEELMKILGSIQKTMKIRN